MSAEQNEAQKAVGRDEELAESGLDRLITEDHMIAPETVDALRSSDRTTRLQAAAMLRRLVDQRETTSIQPIINSGILPDIVSMISLGDVELQVHLNAVLATITMGSPQQVSTAVETGAIPKFILLAYSSTCEEARDDAISGLGNIGVTSSLLRDTVVRQGGLKPLLDILSNPSQHGDRPVSSAAKALGAFTRPLESTTSGHYIAQEILPTLIKYINTSTNESPGPLRTSLRALDNIISDRSLLKTSLMPISHLGLSSSAHLNPPMSRIWRFTASCILSGETRDRSYACFATSNIAAGTLEQAKALIEAGLVPVLVNVASKIEEKAKTRRDAVWTLSGLACNWGQSHHKILETLMEANSLEAFFSSLTLTEKEVVEVSLKGILAFVKTEWKGKRRAIERSKAEAGVTALRAAKLRPEPGLASQRLLAHTLLKVHLQVFSLPPRV